MQYNGSGGRAITMPLFDDPPLHDFPDRAIRRMLEHPANLRDLISVVLPDLVARFDFTRIEIIPSRFLLDDWRRRESDLFVRLPFLSDEQPPVLVALLIEHQSEPDIWMPLRTLLYTVLAWDEEWKAWAAGHEPRARARLTPVVAIVFHTGGRRWRWRRRLADLLDAPEPLRPLMPRWQPHILNLGEQSAEAWLAAKEEFLAAMAVVRAERAGAGVPEYLRAGAEETGWIERARAGAMAGPDVVSPLLGFMAAAAGRGRETVGSGGDASGEREASRGGTSDE
jgi:hypothetical protein